MFVIRCFIVLCCVLFFAHRFQTPPGAHRHALVFIQPDRLHKLGTGTPEHLDTGGLMGFF